MSSRQYSSVYSYQGKKKNMVIPHGGSQKFSGANGIQPLGNFINIFKQNQNSWGLWRAAPVGRVKARKTFIMLNDFILNLLWPYYRQITNLFPEALLGITPLSSGLTPFHLAHTLSSNLEVRKYRPATLPPPNTYEEVLGEKQ